MHTKGPWELRSPTGVYGNLQRDQNWTGDLVARTVRADDARLIAAAPDLLEACKALDGFWLEQFEPPHADPQQQEPRLLTKETLDVWRGIRAAIARATGAGA